MLRTKSVQNAIHPNVKRMCILSIQEVRSCWFQFFIHCVIIQSNIQKKKKYISSLCDYRLMLDIEYINANVIPVMYIYNLYEFVQICTNNATNLWQKKNTLTAYFSFLSQKMSIHVSRRDYKSVLMQNHGINLQ